MVWPAPLPPLPDTGEIDALVSAVCAALPGTEPAGRRVVLQGTAWQPQLPVTVGLVDENAVTAFTSGQCLAFALAVAEATGAALAWLGEVNCAADEDCAAYPQRWGWCPCQIGHIAAVLPDGRVADIRGVAADADAYRGRHGDDTSEQDLIPMSAHQLTWWLASHTTRVPALAAARGFVTAVLADAPRT